MPLAVEQVWALVQAQARAVAESVQAPAQVLAVLAWAVAKAFVLRRFSSGVQVRAAESAKAPALVLVVLS